MSSRIGSIFVSAILLFVVSYPTRTARPAARPKRASTAMVVTANPIASSIGLDVLRRGGNAADAAVAVAFALAVVMPWTGNIGGGGFALHMGNDGRVRAFDFRETAPAKATAQMFVDPATGGVREDLLLEGALSVGVPGTVAGLFLLHRTLGTMKMAELIRPSIELCRRGIEVTHEFHTYVSRYGKKLRKFKASRAKFFKADGSEYMPGELWRQPLLASTLEKIARHGETAFYGGGTAARIVSTLARYGGIMTPQDLARYRALERKPLHGTYRGYDVYSVPPPSSGGVALIEMLNILEGYDLASTGHNSALYLHLLTEAMRAAYRDRAIYLGDPDFNPHMPLPRLLSKPYADAIRRTIPLRRAAKSRLPRPMAPAGGPGAGGETTHFSIVDAEGNALSFTYTLNHPFGSGLVVEGGGFLLNNEMGDFNPLPGVTDEKGLIGTQPNTVAPGKRMLSSMTPTILSRNGRPYLVLGSPGGRTIITTVLQVILNVVDHRMNIEDAVLSGRIHHGWFPDVTLVEEGAATRDTLGLYEETGHRVRILKERGIGSVMAIMVSDGVLAGAADRRRENAFAAGLSLPHGGP